MTAQYPQGISTASKDLQLRFAVEEDAPLVLSFIRRLARYEKLEDAVEATEQGLVAALFGPRPAAEVVLAEYRGDAVGFAVFFHNFSTFVGKSGLYLEDLFVDPSARGLGIGKTLLAFLAHLARERGCGRIEWSVLDWNTPAIDFYRRLGAQPMTDWSVFRLDQTALLGLAEEFMTPGQSS
ncbi:MAG: GNAT family N-acetyltransferase [Gammaproteobacteria bacterium]